MREVAKEEFEARTRGDTVAFTDDNSFQQISLANAACLGRLLSSTETRTALLNTRLPAVQSQLCLRHYLEGFSESARLRQPSDLAADDPLLQAMRLELRQPDHALGAGPARMAIHHGTREVNLVLFERHGESVEAVALDPAAEGYSQLRALWPGHVTDFFSRRSSLRLIDLFAEMRNFSLDEAY